MWQLIGCLSWSGGPDSNENWTIERFMRANSTHNSFLAQLSSFFLQIISVYTHKKSNRIWYKPFWFLFNSTSESKKWVIPYSNGQSHSWPIPNSRCIFDFVSLRRWFKFKARNVKRLILSWTYFNSISLPFFLFLCRFRFYWNSWLISHLLFYFSWSTF